MNANRLALAAAAAILASALAHAQVTWPDTYVSRLEALALIQTLNAELLASRSATQTLEGWCRDHHLAEPPTIVARAIHVAQKPPDADQRKRLEVSATERVRYRRVELRCGAHTLSEADNWYVPGRLTPDMNRQLDTTQTPFGRVVAPLEPYRRTVAVRMLWTPLPDGWERQSRPADTTVALTVPGSLFEHRAVLYTRDHKPFSEVVEVYQRPVLGDPRR
jgi:chorismate-pyruvate lyase